MVIWVTKLTPLHGYLFNHFYNIVQWIVNLTRGRLRLVCMVTQIHLDRPMDICSIFHPYLISIKMSSLHCAPCSWSCRPDTSSYNPAMCQLEGHWSLDHIVLCFFHGKLPCCKVCLVGKHTSWHFLACSKKVKCFNTLVFVNLVSNMFYFTNTVECLAQDEDHQCCFVYRVDDQWPQEPSTCWIKVRGEGEGGGIPVSSSQLAPRCLARKLGSHWESPATCGDSQGHCTAQTTTTTN